jgi:hypothetical protein
MGWSVPLAIAACFSLVPLAWAGALTPTKASQVVTIGALNNLLGICDISPTIPPGQVLLITSANIQNATSPSGGPAFGVLNVGGNTVWYWGRNTFATNSMSTAVLSADKVFVPGIVVKPGTLIEGLAFTGGSNCHMVINGFLATDK